MNTEPETAAEKPKTRAKPVEAPAEVPAEVAAFPLPLDEFCSRLSATDRRVEMISAFHASERAAGRLTDLEAEFASRFDLFCNAPA